MDRSGPLQQAPKLRGRAVAYAEAPLRNKPLTWSASCICRTERLSSLLGAAQRLPSAPRGLSRFTAMGVGGSPR